MAVTQKDISYALITAARNEETHIGDTIRSVISQTVLPVRWVIVSDGSTDGTDEIVSRYVSDHGFIRLERIESGARRDFGSKVRAINRGYELLKGLDFSFIGNLDADITFGAGYYETILRRFGENRKLGISGGICLENEGTDANRHVMFDGDVRGGVQLFRRSCYEQIGGYPVLPMGGEDSVAQILAKINGWEVRSFKDQQALHHRRTGTAGMSLHRSRFRDGMKNYLLGYHPAFMAAKCLSRSIDRPYVTGSASMLAGYLWGAVLRPGRQIPENVIDFLRKEQIRRMKSILRIKIFY